MNSERRLRLRTRRFSAYSAVVLQMWGSETVARPPNEALFDRQSPMVTT